MRKPVEIIICRSHQQLLWLLAVHLMTVIVLLVLPVLPVVKVVLVSLALLAATICCRKWRISRDSILRRLNQQWFLGNRHEVEEVVLKSWYWFGRLLVLNFSGQRPLVVFPDAVDESDYSQLLQQLRFQ